MQVDRCYNNQIFSSDTLLIYIVCYPYILLFLCDLHKGVSCVSLVIISRKLLPKCEGNIIQLDFSKKKKLFMSFAMSRIESWNSVKQLKLSVHRWMQGLSKKGINTESAEISSNMLPSSPPQPSNHHITYERVVNIQRNCSSTALKLPFINPQIEVLDQQ